jgi:2-oxoisovalerate dehydrogenase E2 component (dihydrolipoyl transacylase)
MSLFKLPDLGEGLQEADIREWHVKVGEVVAIDQPLLAVETAKAVVEVPSPRAGRVVRLFGAVGDTMEVGKPLVEFDGDAASDAAPVADSGGARTGAITDTGTVVGAMTAGNEVVAEKATTVGGTGLKVIPAVRALAHRLNVDLSIVTPTGPDGMITAADVQRVHQVLADVGPIEKLKGPRKAMSRAMSQARDEVMPTTVTDDAVLHAWTTPQDLTVRLIRALVAGVKAQPALNAWFDQAEVGRRVLDKIHCGIAVDTPEGLFVAVLQDVASRTPESLRLGLDRMKAAVQSRNVPAEELRGYTITLSNFGRFGGKYATPAILPPTVAIVAAGAIRDAVVPVDGEIRIAKVVPLSVTFDHRCVTGGEATQFLSAMIRELERPE